MKKETIQLLNQCDTFERMEIKEALSIANTGMMLMRTYGVDKEILAGKLEISTVEIEFFLKGTYPYDLRVISKLNAYSQELQLEALKEKFAKQGIVQHD